MKAACELVSARRTGDGDCDCDCDETSADSQSGKSCTAPQPADTEPISVLRGERATTLQPRCLP